MCLYVYMWGGVGLYGGVIAATGVKPGVTDAQRSVVQQLQWVQVCKAVCDC